MLQFIITVTSILFFLCSGYQLFYLLVPHVFKRRIMNREPREAKCAVLICARNESGVISSLIRSVMEQSYHADIFVLADNCTDNTAEVARYAGAVVWERFDRTRVGKGYALSALLSHMENEGYIFERYFIFDADNLLDRDCIKCMNTVFDEGYSIVTGYRSSINFGDNWISAGYGVFFLREARYLNYSRMTLGTSCAVSGTGFGFTREILTEQNEYGDPWPFHLLTEDLQFTAHHVIRGHRIGYSHDAIFYDEQPTDIRQSWYQRLRWAKGGLQVAAKYGANLFAKAMNGSFSAYDILMSNVPAAIFNLICVICNLVLLFDGIIMGDIMPALFSIFRTFITMGVTFFVLGGLTMLTERRRIDIPARKKLLYTLTFPLFMFTYIPISLASFCCKVEWKPIYHKSRGRYEQHTNL